MSAPMQDAILAVNAGSSCMGGLDALAYLGVRIDAEANLAAKGDAIRAIHATGSPVEIWVVPTDEGRVAAADAVRLLGPA